MQILVSVHNTLQWPVVTAAGLDYFCTISLQPAPSRAKWVVHSFVTILLWHLTVLHLLLLSDIASVLEDVSHHQFQQSCVVHTTQTLQPVQLCMYFAGFNHYRTLL